LLARRKVTSRLRGPWPELTLAVTPIQNKLVAFAVSQRIQRVFFHLQRAIQSIG